jgi:hypothetical protein
MVVGRHGPVVADVHGLSPLPSARRVAARLRHDDDHLMAARQLLGAVIPARQVKYDRAQDTALGVCPPDSVTRTSTTVALLTRQVPGVLKGIELVSLMHTDARPVRRAGPIVRLPQFRPGGPTKEAHQRAIN